MKLRTALRRQALGDGMLGYRDFRFPEDGRRRRHPRFAAWCEAVERLPSMRAATPLAG